MFRFVVRRLRWLGRIPLLPQLFDSFLVLITVMTSRRKLRAMELLEERTCSTLYATTGVHRFGGVRFLLDKTELGHMHGNGLVDALVGKASRDELVASGRAFPHHIFPVSGWVSFWLKDEADVPHALELLRIAAEQRASFGRAAKRVYASPEVAGVE